MEMKPRNEAEHFEEMMKTKQKEEFEIDDRIEQAYRQGFIAGTKFTAGKEMATITECMMKAITKAAVQAINCVNYDAVYSSYKAEETAEKHWSECRQISAYEAENKRLKELLIRAFRLLKRSSDPATGIWTEHYEFEVMNLINGKESE